MAVVTIVGIACVMKRRNTARVSYEIPSANAQNNGNETNRYSIHRDHHQALNSVYDTINDTYDEPINSPYLVPVA